MANIEDSLITSVLHLVRRHWLRVSSTSLLLLIPCFWHRRIAAGDLASHVYNAWLAQLIVRQQAPGLYLERRWNNVLVDLALLKIGNVFGLAAAEKIVISACVLIFFWGAFSLVRGVTQRSPWFLTPCLGMLAYGWTFNVGFFNYYLSLGLGFFAIAILWPIVSGTSSSVLENTPGSAARHLPRVVAAVILGIVVLVAHPQGFLWLVGCLAYVSLWRVLRGRWKLIVPLAAAAVIVAVRLYCSHHYEIFSIWESFGPGIYNGSDQLALYSRRYLLLSVAALLFGFACLVCEGLRRHSAQESWRPLRLPFELHLVIVLAIYVLPDALRTPLYAGWIGAFAMRLTTISAVM